MNELACTKDVKEWGTRVAYSLNQKFKDGVSIDTSPYTYPCITKCISANGCIWNRLKLGPTAAFDCLRGQNKGRYCKKELLLLLFLDFILANLADFMRFFIIIELFIFV
jgi:hypothetical protein